jgi:hypothetical protein
MISIEVRNPAEGSKSARKLLRRTPRNQNMAIHKSSSKDKKSTSIFKGAYMKISNNSINNSMTLNNSMSFSS